MAFVSYTQGTNKGFINTEQITKIKLVATGAKVYLAGANEHDTVMIDLESVERLKKAIANA